MDKANLSGGGAVRVKFCGITSVADAQAAEQAGCDAIGLVFAEHSPRYVSVQRAQEICQKISPWITVVGLFVDAEHQQVQQVVQAVPLHVLQFHGSETPDFCAQWQRPWIKAVPMLDNGQPQDYVRPYSRASGWLLDCYGKKHSGGSGKVFDWSLFPTDNDPRWILAGGLNPDNIRDALQATGARSVDVSSGIESSPGVKSRRLMRQFIKNIRCV